MRTLLAFIADSIKRGRITGYLLAALLALVAVMLIVLLCLRVASGAPKAQTGSNRSARPDCASCDQGRLPK